MWSLMKLYHNQSVPVQQITCHSNDGYMGPRVCPQRASRSVQLFLQGSWSCHGVVVFNAAESCALHNSSKVPFPVGVWAPAVRSSLQGHTESTVDTTRPKRHLDWFTLVVTNSDYRETDRPTPTDHVTSRHLWHLVILVYN